ncbi:MAG TPA: glycosyltransferase family 4 protein [Pyrinomonadaceae bacterium]|nr:glycosyltransferase family 4 protein [Pyrinomonadaceae bacterium]
MKNLSVLHINESDRLGGAGRSAYRIHESLKRLGLRSRMLVHRKSTNDDDVRPISSGTVRFFDLASYHTFERLSMQYLFYPSSFLLVNHEWFKEADVVQLFNTHENYFAHTALPLISRRRPVVWRLSDMWSLTGHCTHSLDCERWMTGCGSCPLLSDYPALRWDTTAMLWKIKRWVYARSLVNIVAPSKWIEATAKRSPLLGNFPVHHIPNGVDTTVFKPVDQQQARQTLGIDETKKVILFSSHKILDRKKGSELMVEALARLTVDREKVLLLVVGRGAEEWNVDVPFAIKRMGHVFDDNTMAAVYSAAAIFVLPTLADTFPNAVLESMSCGTVPITFDVGGCPELVRHMETGYLARYKDAEDLAKGMSMLLEDDALRTRLRQRCLEVVAHEYPRELEAKRFKKLYEDIYNERAAA